MRGKLTQCNVVLSVYTVFFWEGEGVLSGRGVVCTFTSPLSLYIHISSFFLLLCADGPRNPDRFSYPHETGLAYSRGSLAQDIAEEQAKLASADTVIFQFPLNWATVPAILKGYFDRVLIQKFAFDIGEFFDKAKFRVFESNR